MPYTLPAVTLDEAAQLNFEQLAKTLGGGTVAFVLTADANGNASWAAIPVNALNLEVPGAPSTPTRVMGTAYQPSTTRPVFVAITLDTGATASSFGTVQIGPTSAVGTQVGLVFGTSRIESTISFWVPTGWYYKPINNSGSTVVSITIEWVC